jgi:hypothetical protein
MKNEEEDKEREIKILRKEVKGNRQTKRKVKQFKTVGKKEGKE